jgi:uncharacterized protein with ParB-like and HNH nuclease domain
VIKQESPDDNDTSVFHVFERLNSGGRKLNAQEIRVALYHGALLELIDELNELESWSEIYGKVSNRLKDKELILRFLAMYHNFENYERPMLEFLNKFAKKYRNPGDEFLGKCKHIFTDTCELMFEAMGRKSFRPERSMNAAVFDSIMVGLSKRIGSGELIDLESVKSVYLSLLEDSDFQKATSYSTADETNVHFRMLASIDAFSSA